MTKLTDNRSRDHTARESTPSPPAKLVADLGPLAVSTPTERLHAVRLIRALVPDMAERREICLALFSRGRRTKLHSSDYPPPRTPLVDTKAGGAA